MKIGIHTKIAVILSFMALTLYIVIFVSRNNKSKHDDGCRHEENIELVCDYDIEKVELYQLGKLMPYKIERNHNNIFTINYNILPGIDREIDGLKWSKCGCSQIKRLYQKTFICNREYYIYIIETVNQNYRKDWEIAKFNGSECSVAKIDAAKYTNIVRLILAVRICHMLAKWKRNNITSPMFCEMPEPKTKEYYKEYFTRKEVAQEFGLTWKPWFDENTAGGDGEIRGQKPNFGGGHEIEEKR